MKKKLFTYLFIIFLIGFIIFVCKQRLDFSDPHIEIPNFKKNVEVKEKRINISAVGDLLFESPLINADTETKNNYFSLVKDKFINDDISIANMEVPIGNDSMTYSGDGYNFCAPPEIGKLVTSLDFEVLSTANNHAFDRGEQGIISTLDFFKDNSDFLTGGTYKDKNHEEAILEKNGVKVGFISYTLGTNMDITNDDMINVYRDKYSKEFTETKKELLKNEVSSLKEKVDIVIAIMHWGQEFTFEINKEQTTVANYLNSIGVNVIIGSHSHSIQPIDIIHGENNDTLVFYSLGNFVSADDDIARTEKGYETFDNAYQFGLYTNFDLVLDDNKVTFENIKTEPIINYFDTNMKKFKLIPFSEYNTDLETSHYRYSLGLTNSFIDQTYKKVIKEEYR